MSNLMTTGVGNLGAPYRGPQIVLLGYGQSEWLGHMHTSSSPDAAAAGTYYFDPNTSAWVSADHEDCDGNGIRKLLNTVAALTGKTVGVISVGVPGAGITAFLKGAGSGATDYYGILMAQAATAGARHAEEMWFIWAQGLGDANATVTPSATLYQSRMDALHGDIVADLGKTKATCPMLISGFGRLTSSAYVATDAAYASILGAQITANDTYPNIHFSHHNTDAPMVDEELDNHWPASAYGKSGERYARTLLWLRGDVATRPNWEITAAEKTSTTVTRLTIVHSMGTDFTPTSGITGFEVSDDGATWIAATAARVDATHIDLTHSALGATTADDRFARYLYGKAPDITGMVVDNGSLAMPLTTSTGREIADLAYPVMSSATSFIIDNDVTFVATLTASRPSTFAIGGTDAADFEILNGNELHFTSTAVIGNYAITITPTAIDNSDEGSAQSVSVEVVAAFTQSSVIADGANDYQKSTGFTGAADSKTGLLFFACIPTPGGYVLSCAGNAWQITLNGSYQLTATWKDTAGTTSMNLHAAHAGSSKSTFPEGEVCLAAIKFDADGNNRMYIWTETLGAWSLRSNLAGNGVAFDFTTTWTLLAVDSGTPFANWNGEVSRFALWTGVDWSGFADDTEWLNTLANPSTGALINPYNSVSALGTPLLDEYGPASEWNAGTNHGSGGNLTVGGAFVDA